MNKKEYVWDCKNHWHEEQKPWIKTSRLYSWLRLACVILAIGLAIYADQTATSLGFYLAGALMMLFVALVVKHNELKIKLRRTQAKMEVADRLLRRMDGSWKEEPSTSVCEKEDALSYDLDLLGPQSLYDYLNMAATPYGTQRLIALIKGEEDALDSARSRQNAIKELLKKQDFLWEYESASVLFAQDSMKLNDKAFSFLVSYGTTNRSIFPRAFVWFSHGMAIVTILCLVLGIGQIIPLGYGAVLLLANIIISLAIAGKSGEALSYTQNLQRILHDYSIMFACAEECSFTDETLCRLQNTMNSAQAGLKKLNTVMDLIALRHNFISYLLLGALVQLDVICITRLEAWRSAYGSVLTSWLEAAGELEALVSLSVIAQVKEKVTFPELIEGNQPIFEVTDAKHPLLSEQQAIANSISLTNGTIVITGSNMSGKTTFLRTLGITMMLARAGTCVCASAMGCTLLDVYSSMRVKDDVNEGISTFYAELLRIRTMMDATKTQRGMLVLIDEIFKGTNSADRILCAKTAITKLHLPWVITLVSTHDFELCALSEDQEVQARNYHFEEYYEQDDIKFDYRLKDGRSTSTNAKELMRLAGIV